MVKVEKLGTLKKLVNSTWEKKKESMCCVSYLQVGTFTMKPFESPMMEVLFSFSFHIQTN